jgi:hypothetical protein
MIEVHTQPNDARSDGAQAVSPADFAEIARAAAALARLDGRRLVVAKDAPEAVRRSGEGAHA